MASLIRQRTIVTNDHWRRLEVAPSNAAALGDQVIVPLAFWLEHRERLLARAATMGVELNGADDPAVLQDDVGTLALIAVRFAGFADGRPFSIARLLRERLGFAGELRAVGHVQRDQLSFMERCGFDAFELRDSDDAFAALIAFYEITETYQGAATRSHAQPTAVARTP